MTPRSPKKSVTIDLTNTCTLQHRIKTVICTMKQKYVIAGYLILGILCCHLHLISMQSSLEKCLPKNGLCQIILLLLQYKCFLLQDTYVQDICRNFILFSFVNLLNGYYCALLSHFLAAYSWANCGSFLALILADWNPVNRYFKDPWRRVRITREALFV